MRASAWFPTLSFFHKWESKLDIAQIRAFIIIIYPPAQIQAGNKEYSFHSHPLKHTPNRINRVFHGLAILRETEPRKQSVFFKSTFSPCIHSHLPWQFCVTVFFHTKPLLYLSVCQSETLHCVNTATRLLSCSPQNCPWLFWWR